jgi:hypothetical protein
MAKLSLYRPEKGNDFKFLDKTIGEQFQVGGTDIFIHKYLGPVNPQSGESSPGLPIQSNPIPELGIQDLILMENRDRHYDPDVYSIRGIYDMQDIDFNLSQFGLFLQNDTIFVMFHLKTCVESLGRKIMAGDVFELPHLKDEYALDDSLVALKRFYVVQDVTRPARGYSQTWYPHLIRAKCVPLVDTQEYKEILDADSGAGDGSTLRDLMSMYQTAISVNDQIIAQAEEDATLSGYDTQHLYTVPMLDGLVDLKEVNGGMVLQTPTSNYYVGYLTGDGIPPNGHPFGSGIVFPNSPTEGQYFLRTDYLPNRLFRFSGSSWIKYEDNVRMTLNNFGTDDVTQGTFAGKMVRKTQKTSFINNTNTATIAGAVVEERQMLSKVLRPKADN